MLSVIIPSYKDPYLHKTIDSLLDNAEGEIEIVVVLDAYWPLKMITLDDRIKIVHLGQNVGMRGAINAGVRSSTGEHIMRTDEHCMFSKGFDVELVKRCRHNWIVSLKRYFLDPVKWEVMDLPPVECEKLVIQGNKKFSGKPWNDRLELFQGNTLIESMAMQGSMWMMHRAWWDNVIGELQTEGYGPHYQDSHEMVFKTWKKGGRLMFNLNAWYAHKHRTFSRTHQEGTKENPANREAGWRYALDTWGEYYEEIKKLWGI